MKQVRTTVAQISRENNPRQVKLGVLMEDYDGMAPYVLVSLSRGSSSSVKARVLQNSAVYGSSLTIGTPISVLCIRSQVFVA